MLETRHSRATIKGFLAFVPRQVSLATRATMKSEKASSKTLEADFNGEAPIVKSSKKEKKKKKKEDKKESSTDLSPLLLSIAAFLKQHGYSKTLAAFQSETSIEQLDGYRVHIMDLETYYKFLETSQYDGKADPNNYEELDFQNDGIANEGKDKKKKKNKSIDAENVDQDGTELLTEALTKKPRYSLCSQGECKDSSTVPLEETNMKAKVARKKKSKTISDSFVKDIEGGNPEDMKAVVKRLSEDADTLKPATENGHVNIHPDHEHVKSKDKKRKNKLISESSGGGEDMGKINIEKENATTLEETAVTTERKSSKKRKKLAAEDDELQPSGKIRSKEGKQGNMKGSQEDEGNDQENQLPESENLPCKRRKIQNGDVDSIKPQEITPGKQLDGLTNETAESATQRSTKKQHNGSAEPKTVNAFQRVKVDEVKFADERLQDNSYWAKDGAEIGYGAKAQEVLGQVKGRDFRHEKTKKKRGSYRGGQIDLQTHSVKFQYSDDE